jgi:NAD-dependent dihydropyrimidine dehydrogenase PreA subunit
MAATWYPTIDLDTCSNCNTCVDFCVHGVFSPGDMYPTVTNPSACIEFCRGCEKICPSESISYVGDGETLVQPARGGA